MPVFQRSLSIGEWYYMNFGRDISEFQSLLLLNACFLAIFFYFVFIPLQELLEVLKWVENRDVKMFYF